MYSNFSNQHKKAADTNNVVSTPRRLQKRSQNNGINWLQRQTYSQMHIVRMLWIICSIKLIITLKITRIIALLHFTVSTRSTSFRIIWCLMCLEAVRQNCSAFKFDPMASSKLDISWYRLYVGVGAIHWFLFTWKYWKIETEFCQNVRSFPLWLVL